MKKKLDLLSNCRFLMKVAFRLEPALFWTRVPFIVVNAAMPFIPILFVRAILNGILAGESERQILLYVVWQSSYPLNVVIQKRHGRCLFYWKRLFFSMFDSRIDVN